MHGFVPEHRQPRRYRGPAADRRRLSGRCRWSRSTWCRALLQREKPELAEVVRAASERMAAEFGRSVLEDSIARGAEIAAAVEALTIKELAQVASTLVSLSSFQQQMSLARQTVGGPWTWP